MTTGSTVEFIGTPAAMSDIQRWAKDLGPAVAKGSGPFAERVAGTVRDRVPVVSGQLAGSVGTNDADDGIEVTMGDGVAYAGWVEFGGSRGRPYVPEGRYLYPTAAEATDEFAANASDIADETARRFPWSTPSH